MHKSSSKKKQKQKAEHKLQVKNMYNELGYYRNNVAVADYQSRSSDE